MSDTGPANVCDESGKRVVMGMFAIVLVCHHCPRICARKPDADARRCELEHKQTQRQQLRARARRREEGGEVEREYVAKVRVRVQPRAPHVPQHCGSPIVQDAENNRRQKIGR